MKEKESINIGGFTANSVIIPLAVVIAILHIVIIVLVFETNRSNSELSEIMQDCSEYQQYATSLQAGNSTLYETASAFAQIPVVNDGEFNTGPLLRYAQELGKERRGPQVAEWFSAHNASADIQSSIEAAAEKSEQMYEIQLHVIALLCSIYPKPSIPELSAIPDVSLTEDELAMTEEYRIGYARSLISNKDYSLLRASVAENIENCHKMVQQEYAFASSKCEEYINCLRILLWIVIFTIIFIMTCAFILFYRWMVRPLRHYAEHITSDQSLDQESIIREMRLVVNAYNALLGRHNKLESILRSAAEIDTLTKLPNRYSLEHYVLNTSEESGAMAVIMFDVNYLKLTNDTKGHKEGDKLLCKAAACIRECFEMENNGHCYRIGGDEFAAVLRDCSEEEVRSRAERFSLVLEREKISISVGYAFAEKTDENSFDELMKKADIRMYAEKKRIHELNSV